MPLGNAREPGQQLRSTGNIAGTAVLDEQRQMRAPVLALGPAVAVAGRGEREGSRLAQALADAALDLGAERSKAAVLDGIFEPSMLAVRPVAPVALHGDDRFGDRDRIPRAAEAEQVADARIGVGLAMGYPHAAADHHVEAFQVAAL